MLDLESFKRQKRLTDMDREMLIHEYIRLMPAEPGTNWSDYSDAQLISVLEGAIAQDKMRAPVTTDAPLRLDIGCGKNKKEGFIGLDQYAMEGVDWVVDLRGKRWEANPDAIPAEWGQWEIVEGRRVLKSDSVDEVHCSHFLEHLEAKERVAFMNELYRIMKPGAKATIVTPHWASNRAYGDMTHCWPPVSEMFFYYLSAKWREDQVPHTDKRWNPDGYDCDFEAGWGYSLHPALGGRNLEYTQHAQTFWKEACQDMLATLTKK